MRRVAAPVEVAPRRLDAVDREGHIRRVAHQKLVPIERGIGFDPQPVVVGREQAGQVEERVFGQAGRATHIRADFDPPPLVIGYGQARRLQRPAALRRAPIGGRMRVINPPVAEQDRMGEFGQVAQVQL